MCRSLPFKEMGPTLPTVRQRHLRGACPRAGTQWRGATEKGPPGRSGWEGPGGLGDPGAGDGHTKLARGTDFLPQTGELPGAGARGGRQCSGSWGLALPTHTGAEAAWCLWRPLLRAAEEAVAQQKTCALLPRKACGQTGPLTGCPRPQGPALWGHTQVRAEWGSWWGCGACSRARCQHPGLGPARLDRRDGDGEGRP